MANIQSISHKKSAVVENGAPKLPTISQLELGELAINFADGYETLSIKNNNDEIVTFTNDLYWKDKELVIAAALNDLEQNKQDVLVYDEVPTENSENPVTSGGIYNYITEIEQGTAAALNDLNGRTLTEDTPTQGSTKLVTSGGLYTYITNIEEVVSEALNDLNDRKQDILDIDNAPTQYSNNPISSNAAFEMSKVTAAALNDLNLRKANTSDVQQMIEDYGLNSLAPVATSGSYNDLTDTPNTTVTLITTTGTQIATVGGVTLYAPDATVTLVVTSGTEIAKVGNTSIYAPDNTIYEVNHGTSDTVFTLTPNTMHIWGEVASLNLSLPQDTNTALDEYLFTFTCPAAAPTTLTLPADVKWVQQPNLQEGKTYQVSIMNGLAGYLTDDMETSGDENIIEEIKLNGTSLIPDLNKAIDITAVTSVTVNGSNYTPNANGLVDLGTISGGSGDVNVIESVKVNGTALTPDANKAVNITSIPASIITQDATHRFVSDTEKTTWNNKISNVQSDWNATSGLAQILNKPTIPDDSNLVHKTGNETITGDKQFQMNEENSISINTNGITLFSGGIRTNNWDWIALDQKGTSYDETLQQALDKRNNVQADWNQTTTTAADYIKNKPTIPTAVTESTVSGWGFTKNTGTVTGVKMNGTTNNPTNGVVDLGTVLTSFTETDPTVPAWAKASTKPTYTAQEVGALPNTYTPPVTSVNGQTGAVSFSIPDDNNLVHKTGNETISGIKSFQRIKRAHTVDVLNEAWNWITYDDMDGGQHTLQQDLDARNNVQADWNQTTTTAADYIKNKPYIKSKRGGEPDSMVTNIGQLGTDSFDHYIYLAGRRVFVNTDNGAFQYNNKEVATKNDIPTNVSAFTNDAGYLTSYTETDPTVPAWAKAASKPTYTAAEVGALPSTYTPPVTSVNGQTGAVNLTIPAAPGTLNTTATTAQSTSSSEALSGNITLHKVAKTGTYNDLIGKPTIPAAQVQSDWNATSGMGVILNKPTIPTVNNATLTIQKNGTTVGTFTANASSNATANILVNELPTVSSSDNGKILQVVNGAWALVNPTSIYSGTSTPDSNIGNNGDIYVQQ